MTGLADFYRGRRVLVTGHTGFKGSWLCVLLASMGADVTGFATAPPTEPSHFALVRDRLAIRHISGDVRRYESLHRAFTMAAPSIVFHLAAQSLVLRSIERPRETFEINVLGTVNVLEAIRHTASVRAAVIVTSDKCYVNDERPEGYVESDRLGGNDPYGASKAAAELAVGAYTSTVTRATDMPLRANVATARAGNVVGGGDWAPERLVPDLVLALARGARLTLRRPTATRPWQHVLEPLSGYLVLARLLASADGERYGSAWNFGPNERDHLTVADVVRVVAESWGATVDDVVDGSLDPAASGESVLLALDSGQAWSRLGWRTVWSAEEALYQAVAWYKAYHASPDSIAAVTYAQIEQYLADAAARGVPWTVG